MPEKRDVEGGHFPQETDIGAGADGLNPVWGASGSLNYSNKPQNRSTPQTGQFKGKLVQSMKQTVASSAFKQKTPLHRRTDVLLGPIMSTVNDDIPQGGFYYLYGANITHLDPIL
jgi:hypothetical protein